MLVFVNVYAAESLTISLCYKILLIVPDFTNPVQVLCLLIYAAAESGAQQFIEMILNSSAGRIVFDAYKDRLLLPEVIAKSHGNEETAHYLEDITKR